MSSLQLRIASAIEMRLAALAAILGLAGAFGGFASVAPASWMEIYGANLSSTTRGWAGSDFVGDRNGWVWALFPLPHAATLRVR